MSIADAAYILRYYLYGTATPPADLSTDTVLRPEGATSSMEVTRQSYMDKVGRFALPSQFEMISTFFSSTSIPVKLGPNGQPTFYTKADLGALFGLTSFSLNVYQYQLDDGAGDYAERTLLWNSGSFMISDDAQFWVEADGTRHIEHLAILPRGSENFDLSSSSIPTLIANRLYLEQRIDPYGLGRTVTINFVDGVAERSYSSSDYLANVTTVNGWTYPADPVGAMASLLQQLHAENVISPVDDDSRPIIYGSLEADAVIDDTTAKPFYSGHSGGLYMVGGAGNDTLVGSDEDDSIDGNGDNDTISGRDGQDIIDGGGGTDTINGGSGVDHLYGGSEADTISGGEEGDFLYGEGGADELRGDDDGGAADVLDGGEGGDRLYGGPGDTVALVDSGDIVFFHGERLTSASRKVSAGASTSETGSYTNGYNGINYDFNQETEVLVVSDNQGSMTLTGFVNGDGGIALKTTTQGEPPRGSSDEGVPTAGDPLVLDLDGDGIEMSNIATTTVYFDTNQDRLVERVGWIGRDDGLLARDLNGDGLVNNMAELFGSGTIDGFSALAKFDSNADGKISYEDDVWSALRVWQDADTDGDTDPGELRTMLEAGIASVSLYAEPVNSSNEGNEIAFRGQFIKADGTIREAAAAYIQIATADPLITGDVEYLEAVYKLPDLSSREDVPTLRSAMNADPDL
jgi:Ca2+-binding RTX toxin-like protein